MQCDDRIAGRSRRAEATHNARRCYLGQSECNFNLIARYFGRAYACNVGRGLIKRLRAALRRHADELARFASPGLRVPAKSERMEDRGRVLSDVPPRDLNLLAVVH